MKASLTRLLLWRYRPTAKLNFKTADFAERHLIKTILIGLKAIGGAESHTP